MSSRYIYNKNSAGGSDAHKTSSISYPNSSSRVYRSSTGGAKSEGVLKSSSYVSNTNSNKSSSNSTKKQHTRSKSVDDVLRGTASSNGVERSNSTAKRSALRDYRGFLSSGNGTNHKMNSTDDELLFAGNDDSKNLIMEESATDGRQAKNKYKIVGRITRSPSPDQKYFHRELGADNSASCLFSTENCTKESCVGATDNGMFRNGKSRVVNDKYRSSAMNDSFTEQSNSTSKRYGNYITSTEVSSTCAATYDRRNTAGNYRRRDGSPNTNRRSRGGGGGNRERDTSPSVCDRRGDRYKEPRFGDDTGIVERNEGGFVSCRPYGSSGRYNNKEPDNRGRSPVRDSFDHSPDRNRMYHTGESVFPSRNHKARSSLGRSRLNKGLPIKRSRSMNDVGCVNLSPTHQSPTRQLRGHGGGAFPVCRRFPNCSVCTIDIPRQPAALNKEPLQHEPDDKSDTDEALIIEKKDKEIQLKSESISQITQMLQKTRRELEMKVNESNRREKEIKQLKEEMKRITGEKKSLEHTNSEQQISLTKLEATDMRLRQMNKRCEQLQSDNRELVEKIKTIEISQKEFEVLEHNVYELEMQLRDMEDIELHRDELLGKLNQVKKQRDEFLVKGKLVEEERNEFVRSNKTLEQYLAEWKKKSIEFKQTNQALKERIMALERDKKELEAKIVEIQLERVSMQGTICKLEAEKDDVVQELREVVLERNSMEERLADIEDVLGDHDELEEGFHSLRLQLSELTRQRDDYEAMTMSYKKKVQLLKRTIRQKEDSILQLTHDIKTLKVAIDDFSPSELPALKSFDLSAQPQPRKGEEYSRFNPNDVESTSESFYDLVPVRSAKYAIPSDDSLTNEKYVMSAGKKTQYNLREPGRRYVALFDYDPTKSSTSDYPERELRLKEGDYITVYGEMDIDGNLDAEVNGMRGLVPGIYVEEATTDESSVDVRHAPHQRMRRERVQRISTSSREHSYIVLYDYDPYTMGTTDRPDLELSLRKGEVITVIGSMGPDGYYTAILPNGKRGLVPSNFVQVYHRHTHNRGHTYGHNRGHTHVRDSFAHPQIQSDEEHFQGLVEVDHIQGPPYAPRDLKVTRVVTRHAVLLSWILPIMDDEEHSNGSKVRGYRIWVNGKKKEDVNGASTNKALVDGVDLIGRIEFSIQTVSVDDLCSEKCHFAITGALSALTSKDESVVNSQGDTYVALYDYDPSKSSPNPNPSLELNFHEGDLMKVFDKSRNDGFFHAEMKGKRGLVPSNFIEFIKSESSSYQSRIKHSSHDESNTRRVQFTKR